MRSGRRQPRTRRERQPRTSWWSLLGASEYESFFVSRDDVIEPLGGRLSAEEQEQVWEGKKFAAFERDRRQLPVSAVQFRDFALASGDDSIPLKITFAQQ